MITTEQQHQQQHLLLLLLLLLLLQSSFFNNDFTNLSGKMDLEEGRPLYMGTDENKAFL